MWNFDRTLSGNLNKSRVLINNVAVTNTNGSNVSAVQSDTDPFTIGAVFRGTSSPIVLSAFEGNIDEISIFNTSLSSDEMTSIYNEGTPNNVSDLEISGLVNYYRNGDNDNGTGTTITDQGSSAQNGNLINTPTFEEDVP